MCLDDGGVIGEYTSGGIRIHALPSLIQSYMRIAELRLKARQTDNIYH